MRNGPYELVVAPDDWVGERYRDRYCYEHQYVYWRHTGQIPVRHKECIRHINGNKRDNRFDNLEFVTMKAHNVEHNHRGKMIELICSFCGREFQRDPRNYNTKVKRGQTKFYCSRECGYKSKSGEA